MPFWELFTIGEVLGDSTGLVPPRLWHWWHREPRLDILQLLLRHVHMAQSSPTWCPRHEHRALGCKATPSPGEARACGASCTPRTTQPAGSSASQPGTCQGLRSPSNSFVGWTKQHGHHSGGFVRDRGRPPPLLCRPSALEKEVA